MGDPRPVEAVAALALLVVADLGHAPLGDLRVAPVRDERGHPADRVRAAPMAGPDEQLRVGPHERHGHRQLGAVRGRQRRVRPELLDPAEQVVPAAGVQARGVLAQLVQDLVHLEGGEDRLDQDGRPDRAARDAERGLAVDEDLVPEPRLVVRLELGQVEVRPAPLPQRLGAVVEQVQPEVEQAGRDRHAVDQHPRLDEVPAARPDDAASRSSRRAGTPCPRASRRSSVRRTASASAAWPPTTLAHVGDSASSRSAMNTRAPELSALIIILGSAGPVISTRRSSRSAGAGATVQSSSRTSRVATRKSGRTPASSSAWRSSRRREEVEPARPEPALEVGDERERVRGQDPVAPGDGPRGGARPRPGAWCRSWSQPSPRRTVASMRPCGSVVGV